MASHFDPANLLAEKEKYYESVTRNVRWAAIALVVATFSPSHHYYSYFLTAAIVAVVFNILRYIPHLMRYRWFASRITTLVCDNFLIAILLLLSGGPKSPYMIFWVLTLISAAYWYGKRGTIMVALWAIASSMVMYNWHGAVTPEAQFSIAIVRLGALIAIAFLAERLTHADRDERTILTNANRLAEAQRQQMATLINSMVDPVLAVDKHHKITIYNGAALDLLNTNERITGKPLEDYLRLEDATKAEQSVNKLLAEKAIVRRSDLLMKLGSESRANIDLSIAPIRTSGSGIEGFIIILRDITKQKSLDQQRDEFIAVTSHELRTPVAIAEANLSTALLPNFGKIDPKVKTLIEQAHQNIVFLGQLIKDLSTLAKAERGSLEVQVSRLDPAAVVRQLIADYDATARSKHLRLETHLDNDLKPISSSVNLIHEVLQNFITNAIKYTEKGQVVIAAGPGKGGRGVVFSVADSGIGISASDKKQLFNKFFRSEDYRTRKTNGTGLGLYVTKKLAERLGAEIWCDSKLNKGSTFYLWVPPLKESGHVSQAAR